jgi:cadmium resistance protein CadD (predicted permease)
MLSLIGIAVSTFIVTNIDDLLILSFYFASSGYKFKNIVLGQYLGIVTLIGISFLGFFLNAILEYQWISLLGMLPVFLGIKDLVRPRGQKNSDQELPTETSLYSWLNVATVTLANGGDNLGTYTPLFANLDLRSALIYVFIFLALTALWCFFAYYLVRHPILKKIFSTYGKAALPVFLILLGIYIMRGFVFWLVS